MLHLNSLITYVLACISPIGLGLSACALDWKNSQLEHLAAI